MTARAVSQSFGLLCSPTTMHYAMTGIVWTLSSISVKEPTCFINSCWQVLAWMLEREIVMYLQRGLRARWRRSGAHLPRVPSLRKCR